MALSEFSANGDGVHRVRNGAGTVRFGEFEADLHAGEVRKAGARVKLQEQPFKVLQILLENPGSLVTRNELQARIWPTESFGDFDHAVNVAVGKLRMALGDTADNPSFIETVPRRGYRFVAKLEHPVAEPVAVVPPAPVAPVPVVLPPAPARPRRRWAAAGLALLIAALLIGIGLGVGTWFAHRNARVQAPDFQRLTSQHGTIYSAKFAADGQTVVYSASWDGAPIEIFSIGPKSAGTRTLAMPATDLLAVSSSNEMAVLQPIEPHFMLTVRGTLGTVSLSGGSPRPIAENVEWADYAPDGKSMAIVRDTGTRRRLEFPIGHVLYDTMGWVGHPRVSPDGNRIAFLDHPTEHDDQGVVSVVDLNGHKTVLSSGWESEQGLAWSPDGKEVWFSAAQAGLERRIYAVDLFGRQRLAYRALGGVTLHDIAPDGRVLLTRDENRAGMMGMAAGATKEQDLSWLDWSLPVDLSADGTTLLFDEQGEQSGPHYTVATRTMQGGSPIALGEGMAGDFSPDGKWAASVVSYSQLLLLPTGAGNARKLDRGDIQQYGHMIHWMPDSKQVVFSAILPGQVTRCFIQNIDGGKPRPITPEGVLGCSVSPDGTEVLGSDLTERNQQLFPVNGGPAKPIPGVQPGDAFYWSPDPHILYVYAWKKIPLRLFKLNAVTGERTFFKEIRPSDVTGVCDMSHVLLSRDGRAYVYSYTRMLSDLYLVKGLS